MAEEISSQDAKTIRLIKAPRPPAEAQIEELLSTARKNLRTTVELPFAESQEPYMLSSFVDTERSECFWMFYKGVGPDASLLWNMMTDDPGLIHHLMTSQFPALETGFSVPKSPAVARAVANYKDAHESQLPSDSEFEFSENSEFRGAARQSSQDLQTLPDSSPHQFSQQIPSQMPGQQGSYQQMPAQLQQTSAAQNAPQQQMNSQAMPQMQQSPMPQMPMQQPMQQFPSQQLQQMQPPAISQAPLQQAQAQPVQMPQAPSQQLPMQQNQPTQMPFVQSQMPLPSTQPSHNASMPLQMPFPQSSQQNISAQQSAVPDAIAPFLTLQTSQAATSPGQPQSTQQDLISQTGAMPPVVSDAVSDTSTNVGAQVFSAPQAQHSALEPPPGYTPLQLPQGIPLAHTPLIQPEMPLPGTPDGQAAGGFSPTPNEQSVEPRRSDKTLKLEKSGSQSQADSPVKTDSDKQNKDVAPKNRGWLKDDRGTSMVVEPVADKSGEFESPFVQPTKKSLKTTQQKMKARPMLEGDLTNLQMPTLLQSINMGKMTGRLDLQSGSESAVIYFKEGMPLHCQLRNHEGETALVEAIGWDEGEFRFFMESPHHRDTIKKRLDLLLMEGAALIDQAKFLKEIGVNLQSYLVRNHADITEQLFEQMVEKGAAADMNLQKMLYQLIDNESTLEDLLRLRPMPKPRWVPVIFNLVTCSLVSFSDRPLREGVEEAAAENIDWPAIQAFEDSIKIAETGFLSYPAFFYHLEREYERFERFQRPFSLIILEISIKEELSETKDPKVLQDRAVLGQVSTRVDKLKRKTDIAGHFGDAQFALLLLETEGEAARNFASRLAESIAANPFTTDRVQVVRLTVRLGVASVPETCRDLGRLISAAHPQKSQKE